MPNIPREDLDNPVIVSNPLGHILRLTHVYHDCPLVVQGKTFPASLIELPHREFDVILGMDWLTANQAVVDCGAHTVRLRAPDSSDILIRGELLPKALVMHDGYWLPIDVWNLPIAGSWYEPPYCRDYTLFAEEQIEANKVAIRERAKLLESLWKEKEFERRLCEGSEMMQKILDDYQRERLEAEAKADKLVNDLCKTVELKRSLQSQDQMREINVQKEALEPKTNPEPINHQVPVLEDSLSSTPSKKPESITTLARATVVMLPESLLSQVPTSIVVHELEPTEGVDSEPPKLIHEQKEEGVLPLAINDHLLNCVEDTPPEEPVLEEVGPITCPQDSIESEQESTDEEILCIEKPIPYIETFANNDSSEVSDHTFFDSLLDGYDYVCPKDSWNQTSWDELLQSDIEDSFMGESTVVIIKPQMDSQPIEDKEEINLAMKANDVDLLRRFPPAPINTRSLPYNLLPPSHRDESRILDLDRTKIQTRWETCRDTLQRKRRRGPARAVNTKVGRDSSGVQIWTLGLGSFDVDALALFL
ncbi:unnamed protein product [Cuscuta campestris]|uniref:Uncharacterized protein n=1 Tax=Cuscuta campestris TaxID=132261 RepID=A0A484MD04_9ASTE|nr:unnamed protein product [Cuscuta campestris]